MDYASQFENSSLNKMKSIYITVPYKLQRYRKLSLFKSESFYVGIDTQICVLIKNQCLLEFSLSFLHIPTLSVSQHRVIL